MRARPFERSVVAVVNRKILPDSSTSVHAVLRNTTLCHPGVGVDDIRPLSDTLSGYLESLVLERSCDPDLSLTENRVKSLSEYFGKACKAGAWLPDSTRDAELKRKYSSMCAACGNPSKCSASDVYWGNSGALACLGNGAGDVTWAELDDVNSYFALTPSTNPPSSAADQFAYLCRDGTWQDLNNNPEPCVWLHRPWPVIVAKKKAAEAVASLDRILTNTSITVDQHWRGALAALMEIHQAQPEKLQPPKAPLDYLARAKGFREAYSQTGCDPPRFITLCTTSFLAKAKCEWLSEAGAVYGIAPPLQCVVRKDMQECMKSVSIGESDVTVGNSDWLVKGKRDLSIAPVLHEATPIVEKTSTVVAYVRKDSAISSMVDLRGKKAAFPRHDGAAWHSVLRYITENQKITCSDLVGEYFEEICAPGVGDQNPGGKLKDCYEEGEMDPLRYLAEGKTDVAFVSINSFNLFKGMPSMDASNIRPLCPDENQMYCFISWSNVGHVFAANNVTDSRRHEIVNVMTKLDQLFGKHPPFHNPMFSMYGAFNHEMDVIFHNNTKTLATDAMLAMHPYDKIPMNFEREISKMTDFVCGYGVNMTPSLFLLISLVVFVILR
ncbi:transferrin isoform X2 [Bombyx mori]